MTSIQDKTIAQMDRKRQHKIRLLHTIDVVDDDDDDNNNKIVTKIESNRGDNVLLKPFD